MSRLALSDTLSNSKSECPPGKRVSGGLLVINADDWGQDRNTTERTLECFRQGSISSVNFPTPLSAANGMTKLIEHQQRISSFLRRHRFAQTLFHPGLVRSFEYVVTAQLDEFTRLYGALPDRIDGHHHMHLCANVILQNLLPSGTIVRRNFSFLQGEKGVCNRVYRRLVDSMLRRRHQLMDFLFALPPLQPPLRLDKIFSLARQFRVELETHPHNPEEYRFLTGGEFFRRTRDLTVVSSSVTAWYSQTTNAANG